MILYYALTLHQQIACILHKEIYAPSEEAHLYLSNGNAISDKHMERLKESGFFSNIVIMDDQPAWGMYGNANIKEEKVLEETLKEITELCYRSLLIPLDEYDEIYISADHFPFGMAIIYNEIPYYYIEEATGVYGSYKLWLDIIYGQKNMLSYYVAQRYGLQGRATNILKRFVDLDKQSNDIEEQDYINIVDFSIPKLLKRINKDAQNRILKCFDVLDKISVGNSDKNAIIMSEYLAHAKFCTWEEQKEIYGRFIDYFCENMNVFVKPHPNDHQGIYEKWFPNVVQIEKNIPAELLPLVIEGDISLSIALTSTSVYVLSEDINNTYLFRNKDLRSIKLIKNMDLYYVAIQLVSDYLKYSTILGIGADCLQIKYFLKTMKINETEVIELDDYKLPCSGNRNIVIVDSLKYAEMVGEQEVYKLLKNAQRKDVFIFLNTDNDVLFFDDDRAFVKYTIPIEININRENGERTSKWIYCYTEDESMRQEIMVKEIDKFLANAGIEVKVNGNDKGVRERVLEGMLRATEQKCVMLTKRK